jgi:alkylation response protein AidB-like acyl-CoA dehydrogenase
VAVIANSPVAASMPVWLGGSPAQQEAVAESVLAGRYVALGLTEVQHGADLLASEVTARRVGDVYVVNGTKWLINNVRRARYLCLLVREPERPGLRSLSFLLVDLQALAPASYELLPRIRTHGICGADIAGITLRDAVVPVSALVGRPGRGLELTARSLAVTRTLVPGLSLGVLETALRCTLDFLVTRRLYGGVAVDIPFVQEELAAAYLDLLLCDVVARCCVRVVELLPELAPISSAVAKYVVPHVVEARMRRLSTLLGARYFLREGHWSGVFEKLLRDVRLFSLFDGSEPVVLSALAAQLPCLHADVDPRRADGVFRAGPVGGRALAELDFETVADDDAVTAGLHDVCTALRRAHPDDRGLAAALDLLETQAAELRAQADHGVDPRSEAGQLAGERYARLFAAICVAREWHATGGGAPRAVPVAWLAAALQALLRPGERMPRSTSESLLQELMTLRTEQHHLDADRGDRRTRCPQP